MSNMAHEKSMHLTHISFVVEEKQENGTHVILWRKEKQEEQLSRREMEGKSVEEEMEESVVTLDVQSPLCQTSF